MSEPVHYPTEGNEFCFSVEETSFWFRHRNRCILAAVDRFPPAGTIFDVGGGNGFVSMALQQAGYDVALLEPGETGAANALRRGVKRVIRATLQDAGLRPASLPAVGLFDVLEHVDDDSGFLHAIRELLVPAGMLYLTVPAYSFLWSSEDEMAGHRKRYTLGSLRTIFKKQHFDIRYATYFFSPLPLPIFLFRTLRKRQAPAKGEHQLPRGLAGRFVARLLTAEWSWIRRGAPVPFGSSCLIAAKKG